ncbi:hypothetical protein V5H40_27155, partial [Salmonella enterica]
INSAFIDILQSRRGTFLPDPQYPNKNVAGKLFSQINSAFIDILQSRRGTFLPDPQYPNKNVAGKLF